MDGVTTKMETVIIRDTTHQDSAKFFSYDVSIIPWRRCSNLLEVSRNLLKSAFSLLHGAPLFVDYLIIMYWLESI